MGDNSFIANLTGVLGHSNTTLSIIKCYKIMVVSLFTIVYLPFAPLAPKYIRNKDKRNYTNATGKHTIVSNKTYYYFIK
jgi:hypothetical protein